MSGFRPDWNSDRIKDVAPINAASPSSNTCLDCLLSIPSVWRVVRFKTLFRVIYRYPTYFNIEYVSEGIPEVRGEALTPDGFIERLVDERYVSSETSSMFPMTQLEIGDIVMSVRGTMGKIGLVDERYAGANITANLLRLSPDQTRVTGEFLRWLMRSTYFNEALNSSAPQTTIKTITMPQLAKLRIGLPPLPEQERIAAYLDVSCAAIDSAVTAKRHQLETLEDLRKIIITRSVTRGIEDEVNLELTGNVWMESIPRGWSLICLKRIADIQTGLTLGKTYEGPLIERPYLRVANVQDGHLDLEDITLIEVPANVAARVELQAGDVLMTEGGDLDKLGRGYLWNGQIPNCLHQNHIFAVRCFLHKLRPMFLAYATASNHGRDYFEATGKRTTNLASTNSTKVGLFPIPLPPITEQDKICDFLDGKLTEVRRIASGIETQIATLTSYRKSLIHECVTGQRRLTDEALRQMQQ